MSFDICTPCYTEGRFPSTLFSGDFVKIIVDAEKDSWNDQDTLLFLEAIEMYDDYWNKLSTGILYTHILLFTIFYF